ncbi:MAG: class I SAM-dependent methyltransferase [Candidatus Margulisiibacteriota bacterium]|mgnify:FL=1
MKVRDSGMPDEEMRGKFFDPEKILKTLGMNGKTIDVAEFGCGYGTFTIPAAKMIKGKIFAIDIEPGMISITKNKKKEAGLDNIVPILRDFMADGSGLKDESVDYAMLFNILHLENPVSLLLEAKRILRKGGKVGIIHWTYDSTTPRGPAMEIRPKPEDCIKWAREAGFVEPVRSNLKPYHYGIVLTKKEDQR